MLTDETRQNLRLTNSHMQLELIALIGHVALLKRLNNVEFIVCNGLQIHNDFTCQWDYSLGYFEHFTQAWNCFQSKVQDLFEV